MGELGLVDNPPVVVPYRIHLALIAQKEREIEALKEQIRAFTRRF